METLARTETPSPNAALKAPPLKIIQGWKDRRVLAVIMVCLLAGNIFEPIALVSLLYRDQIVLVVDAEGNMIVGPGVDFAHATAMQTTHAVMATQALLSLSPAGYDEPELLKNLFHDNALKHADATLKGALPEIQAKDIHQKCEIAKVEVLAVKQEGKFQMYYLRTSGQIIKSDEVQGQPLREVEAFELTLRCVRNPRLTVNGRFPLVVVDYKLTEGSL